MANNNNNMSLSPQQRINLIWDRIENKLKTSDVETFNRVKSLGGVSNDEIMQAEMVIGFDFPQDFVFSLKRHDLSKEVECFSVYGYRNSFGDMLENYLKNLNESNYDMEGLFPIFTINEEGGKFFVCLDLETGILCFIDYGGESYVASGRVIAWSFTEYLESFAKNLEGNKIPYKNAWPPVTFGFHGTEDIFRLFPAKRLLKISQSEDGSSFDWKFSIQEAYQNPNENIEADVPEFYVDVKNLPPIPKGTGAEYPSLRWDDQRSSQGVVLKNNGATLRGEGYNIQACSAQVLPTRAYFEIEVGPRMTVSGIGLAAESFTAHTDEGQNGLRIAWTGSEIHIFAGGNHTAMLYPKEEDQDMYAQFQKGERIGVLLDVVDGDRMIQFYRNRVPFGNISLAQMVGKSYAAQRFRAYTDIHMAEVTLVDLH